VYDVEPNPSDNWGSSRASAKAVALLFAKLAFGDILNAEMRQIAIDNLSDVVPEQRWGVTAGTPEDVPPGTTIGIKDGWYPAGSGWWVNSAGMFIPPDMQAAYTIAVLTQGQPSEAYGIATIEGAAEPIHKALPGSSSARGIDILRPK